MIKGIDHIGIAVRSLDETLPIYDALFGLKPAHFESLEREGVRLVFIPVGDDNVEFLEPTKPEAALTKFLERRGEGIHHICLKTDDIVADLKSLAAKGVELVDKEPRIGSEGRRVAFLHPKAARGVLIELAEEL
ncbi:MAG: methylmalonyl-CoA epimerase [Dehalococcoidia bacterium]